MSKTENILYLEHIAGIAGDMFTAACLDAGVIPPEFIQQIPAQLGLEGLQIEINAVEKSGIQCTALEVNWQGNPLEAAGISGREPGGHHHVSFRAIEQFISHSGFSEKIKGYSLKILGTLGEAEAAVHGVDLDKVEFHELGDVDSIIDVVMAGCCLAKLEPFQVFSSPVKLGRGTIAIKHGTFPVPAPAVARLAEGMIVDRVPDVIGEKDIELSTPTGLAILKSLNPVFIREWPGGKLSAQGYGAGTRNLEQYPNVLRVAVFSEAGPTKIPYVAGKIAEITCNLDDQTGERSAWILGKLIENGALDAWYTPITGKKNRPALVLSVLADPASWEKLADWILRQSSTFGLRYRILDKLEINRQIETRETRYGPVRYKIGLTTDGEKLKEKPEFDDLEKIWKEHPDFQGTRDS